MAMAEEPGQEMGVVGACRVLSVPRSSLYRAREPQPEPGPRPAPPRAQVREVLDSERFRDRTPREVYATLLDEGVYLCHWRTMYRILAADGEPEEEHRRRRARRIEPELCGREPNRVWSWDITQLKGRGEVYCLYTVIDMYSRYIVGG